MSPGSRVAVPANSDEILENHWIDMPNWAPTRVLWSVYVTLNHEPAVLEVADYYQTLLGGLPQLDMVRPGSFHITIQGINFVDELDEEGIAPFIQGITARLADFDMPRMSTGLPVTDTDAVYLPITPVQPFVQLRSMIESEAETTLGPEFVYRLPEPRLGFNPHISIAYANARIASSTIYDLAYGAAPVTTSFDVSSVSLIKLSRQDRAWTWVDEWPMLLRSATSPAGASSRR